LGNVILALRTGEIELKTLCVASPEPLGKVTTTISGTSTQGGKHALVLVKFGLFMSGSQDLEEITTNH
jgi:hypothetical protein